MRGDLGVGAMKGRLPGKPLVDGDGQSILVAGRAGLALKLFRGHIGDGAGDLGLVRGKSARGCGREAEVAQQQFVVVAQQHIFWLDISVDLPGTVCVVQGDSCQIADPYNYALADPP